MSKKYNCPNCKHYGGKITVEDVSNNLCAYEFYTGKILFCENMRNSEEHCGNDGKWYEEPEMPDESETVS